VFDACIVMAAVEVFVNTMSIGARIYKCTTSLGVVESAGLFKFGECGSRKC
jgi:hypothetical protein